MLSPRLSRAFEGRQAVSKVAQVVLIVHISRLQHCDELESKFTFSADVVRVGPEGVPTKLLPGHPDPFSRLNPTANRPLQRLRNSTSLQIS